MGKFFDELDHPVTSLRFEEIIPSASGNASSADAPGRGVYSFYIRSIKKGRIDDELLSFRQKSLSGDLAPHDCKSLNQLLDKIKTEAQTTKGNRFDDYAHVKSCAMFIAQILFVNYTINEGLLDLIDSDSKTEVLKRLSDYIKECASKNNAALQEDEVNFYATLFTLQSAFDQNFVPDENIVQYHTESGQYEVTPLYKRATLYLTLTNKQVIHASPEEKELCANITTGWSHGIDLSTWNELNRYYYKEGSYSIEEGNLFTSNYDQILERMLPQFAFSKVRCAEEVLKREYDNNNQPLKVIEIGAGSGAFAIDLFMACKRLGINADNVEYIGLEPSDHMRSNFKKNMALKLGGTNLPEEWRLEQGDLEAFTTAPSAYVTKGKAIVVFSYSAHHCFNQSLRNFFTNPTVQKTVHQVYVLDVVKEHGWTKPYYMWVDCESPENFNNIMEKGNWNAEPLWLEPNLPIEGTAVINAWCCLKRFTAPL